MMGTGRASRASPPAEVSRSQRHDDRTSRPDGSGESREVVDAYSMHSEEQTGSRLHTPSAMRSYTNKNELGRLDVTYTVQRQQKVFCMTNSEKEEKITIPGIEV